MQKAWETKALLEKLKGQGLDVAEDAGKVLVEVLFEWAEESIDLTPSKLDDLGKPVLGMVKNYLLKKIDELDGKVD